MTRKLQELLAKYNQKLAAPAVVATKYIWAQSVYSELYDKALVTLLDNGTLWLNPRKDADACREESCKLLDYLREEGAGDALCHQVINIAEAAGVSIEPGITHIAEIRVFPGEGTIQVTIVDSSKMVNAPETGDFPPGGGGGGDGRPRGLLNGFMPGFSVIIGTPGTHGCAPGNIPVIVNKIIYVQVCSNGARAPRTFSKKICVNPEDPEDLNHLKPILDTEQLADVQKELERALKDLDRAGLEEANRLSREANRKTSLNDRLELQDQAGEALLPKKADQRKPVVKGEKNACPMPATIKEEIDLLEEGVKEAGIELLKIIKRIDPGGEWTREGGKRRGWFYHKPGEAGGFVHILVQHARAKNIVVRVAWPVDLDENHPNEGHRDLPLKKAGYFDKSFSINDKNQLKRANEYLVKAKDEYRTGRLTGRGFGTTKDRK